MATSTLPTLTLPHGFIPVMLTPFLSTGDVDYPGLSALTEFYLKAGAAGLFANCLSSEMYELTDEERLSITKHVVTQVGGRVPVVATGTFGGPLDKQADFIKRLYATGIQAVIVITSQLVDHDDDDTTFLANLFALMDHTPGIPLGLYECPVPYKRLITSDILARLLPTGRLIYHKDTSLDADEVSRRLAVADGYTFGLYDAYMVNAVSSLRAGAAGLSCIQGNLFPELIAWLCKHATDRDYNADVEQVQTFLTDCMELVHTAYPTLAKYALQKRGVPMSLFTRRQTEPLTDALKRDVDELFIKLDNLTKHLYTTKPVAGHL